jgi:pimeloyl-ACP methyl ester carboxylesterase
MVGYSLGGGICASFVSYFPHLVKSLVLLGPSGLLRPKHISPISRILYSHGVLPESFLQWAIKRRMTKQSSNPEEMKTQKEIKEGTTGTAEAAAGEAPSDPLSPPSDLKIPGYDVAGAVAWQVAYHSGFITSFMSSIRRSPITEREFEWTKIGARLSAQNTQFAGSPGEGLDNGKVLLVLGETDPIIVTDEISEDATTVLEGNVDIRVIAGAAHDFPVSRGKEVAAIITDFWKL